jgi:uncharacterized glyoxalase superfamily protein PhnB
VHASGEDDAQYAYPTMTTLPTNRSVPDTAVMPVLGYRDVRAAVEWLCRAFGCIERLRIGNHRAQLLLGDGVVVAFGMSAPNETVVPVPDAHTHSVLARVPDVDAHCERARGAGARIINEPTTHAYGERQYTAEDIGGHRWTFSQTIADSDPADWGGELLVR